jgi:tryptophan halogenase
MIKINKIVIVGGGSAGWMTASHLISHFPNKDITLIESKDVPKIGVGESTQQKVFLWAKSIGIDHNKFMKETDASYKLSIRFKDFNHVGDEGFHYPFGHQTDAILKGGHQDWYLKKQVYPETPNSDFVNSIYSQMSLIYKNKINTNAFKIFDNFNFERDIAFHFDAIKFAWWLKEKFAMPKGVKHIESTVIKVNSNDNGVESLDLENGDSITADLFIDCTGFKSLLISETLKEPFIDYSESLPCNRAWAVQIPYVYKEKELLNYTNCTALKNGWVWNTPLWSRIGTGYVYSDKFTTPEAALEEFKDYLKNNTHPIHAPERDIESLKFNDIKFKTGRYDRVWVKNVIAIGLSAGFIEPLESNGLWTVHEYLRILSRTISRGYVTGFEVAAYNKFAKVMYDGFSAFVQSHYALSQRDDSDFWKYMTSQNLKIITDEGSDFNDYTLQRMTENGSFVKSPGMACINVGHGVIPFSQGDLNTINSLAPINPKPYLDEIIKNSKKYMEIWEKESELSPSHYEYLKKKFHTE